MNAVTCLVHQPERYDASGVPGRWYRCSVCKAEMYEDSTICRGCGHGPHGALCPALTQASVDDYDGCACPMGMAHA